MTLLHAYIHTCILSLNLPTIIRGDFNEDLSNNRHSCILDTSSYTQLLQSSTTDRGTLISHVYYNRPVNDVIVQLLDTYYSDHDTVCSIVHVDTLALALKCALSVIK